MTTFTHRDGQHHEVAGARIYTESIGPADAKPLVLLHGGFGQLEDFNPLGPLLEGWRLVAIDCRGHGMSTLGTLPWTYQRVQEDVEKVLQSLGITRCSMLGFSDGGIAALRLAAEGRVSIERLVVIGSTWHRKNLAGSKHILQGVTPESWRAKFPQTYTAYQRLNPQPEFERFARALVDGWLDETHTGHPDDAVTKIRAPVLIVRGDEDHLTTLTDCAELRDKLPDGHFLGIPYAGHVAYVEGLEVLRPALQAFLRRG
jgi:pimeloyl-ACP methyl ester carboxylesterase